MKITDVKVILLKCSVPEEYKRPTPSFVSGGSILLKVYTDEGITGIGEPSPYGGPLLEVKRIIETQLKNRFLAKNPFDVEILTIQNERSGASGYGNVPYNCAVAGIAHALWDIIGKTLDMPVYRLINRGGDYKEHVRAYASLGPSYEWEDAETLVEEVVRLKEEGYTALKMRPAMPQEACHPSGRGSHFDRQISPPAVDIDRLVPLLEKVRSAVGEDMDLIIDGGCRFQTIKEALMVARVLEDLDFYFWEEPMPRVLEDYAALVSEVEVPIAGGESLINRHQFRPWIDQRAYDIVQPDCNLAGITEVMGIAAMAEARGLRCLLHNWTSAVSIAASVQVAAAIPNCPLLEHSVNYNPLRTEIVEDPVVPKAGFFHVSDRPGLGIELDEEGIKRFAYDPLE